MFIYGPERDAINATYLSWCFRDLKVLRVKRLDIEFIGEDRRYAVSHSSVAGESQNRRF